MTWCDVVQQCVAGWLSKRFGRNGNARRDLATHDRVRHGRNGNSIFTNEGNNQMAIQIAEKQLTDPRERGQTVVYYKRSQLTVKQGFNVRDMSDPENIAHVEWLAEQIHEKGFTSIIRVMKMGNETVVTRGHCRMAAVDLLIERGHWNDAEHKIQSLTEPKGTNAFDLLAIQHTGDDNKKISHSEAVANVKRMMTFGKTEAEVAKAIGKSPTYVRDMLLLASAPASVEAAVQAGEISKTEATKIVRQKGPLLAGDAVEKMIKTARAKGKDKATAADEPKQTRKAAPTPVSETLQTMVIRMNKWEATKLPVPHATLRNWLKDAGQLS